jgi:hypothetical protein
MVHAPRTNQLLAGPRRCLVEAEPGLKVLLVWRIEAPAISVLAGEIRLPAEGRS